MTEKEIAWSMESAMRLSGAQRLAFAVIVASGPNSALPHAIPTDRRIQTGEPILIDWGACLNAYCSDTTRTMVLGKPDDQFNKVFETVVTAREKAIGQIKAGVSGTQIDKVEPGVYLPGWGGVRMENQVVVRSDGAQVLNASDQFDPWIRL